MSDAKPGEVVAPAATGTSAPGQVAQAPTSASVEAPAPEATPVPGSVSPAKEPPIRPKTRPLSSNTLDTGDVILIRIPDDHIEGHEQFDTRPWVVVSQHKAHGTTGFNMVGAVPLTTEMHQGRFPLFRIPVKPSDIHSEHAALRQEDCLALVDQLRCLSVLRATHRLGKLGEKAIHDIAAGIAYFFGLEDLLGDD